MIAGGWIAVAALAVLLVTAAIRHAQVQRGLEPGVVSAQLARTGQRLFAIFDAWGESGREQARRLIRIDRWIIIGYSPGLAVLWLMLIAVFRDADIGTWTSAGTGFALAMSVCALGAGLADVIENRQLIDALNRWADPPKKAVPATRQAHTRALAGEFDAPARSSTRAAKWKFALLAVVVSSLLVPLTVWLTTEMPA